MLRGRGRAGSGEFCGREQAELQKELKQERGKAVAEFRAKLEEHKIVQKQELGEIVSKIRAELEEHKVVEKEKSTESICEDSTP